MGNGYDYESFRPAVKPALMSKIDEFKLLGYDTVTEEELWNFLIEKKWKKITEGVKLYQIVDDIMSVRVGEYMNYASVEALKADDFSFDNEEDLKELLK